MLVTKQLKVAIEFNIYFFPIHGSQWLPSTVRLPALFKISSEERNSFKFGNPNVPFWVNYPCKLELVNYQIISMLIQPSAIYFVVWLG